MRLSFPKEYLFLQVFVTSENLAIVFEYAPGGNLANYIETFQSSKAGRGISEVEIISWQLMLHESRHTACSACSCLSFLQERTRWIFQQIVVAVDYCHKMGIANR